MPVQPRCRSEVGTGLEIADELMGAAVEIVTMAGRLAAQRFNEGSPVRIKADGSQVTSQTSRLKSSSARGHLHDGLLELVRGVPDGRDFRALMRPTTPVSHEKEIAADRASRIAADLPGVAAVLGRSR